jgi:hypothetical protein
MTTGALSRYTFEAALEECGLSIDGDAMVDCRPLLSILKRKLKVTHTFFI